VANLKEAHSKVIATQDLAPNLDESSMKYKRLIMTHSDQNYDSDSFQSSDDFDLSPLQIEGIKRSSAWLTDILANDNRDKLTIKLDTWQR